MNVIEILDFVDSNLQEIEMKGIVWPTRRAELFGNQFSYTLNINCKQNK